MRCLKTLVTPTCIIPTYLSPEKGSTLRRVSLSLIVSSQTFRKNTLYSVVRRKMIRGGIRCVGNLVRREKSKCRRKFGGKRGEERREMKSQEEEEYE